MTRIHSPLTAVVALTLVAYIAGCDDASKKPAPAPSNSTTRKDDHKHDHGDHDHDHGKDHDHDEHDHHEPGPHGGTILDWGGGALHVEFTVDHGKQEVTVYTLGDDAKTAKPIKAKDGKILLTITKPSMQVELAASPQKGDPEGTASRFVGKNEALKTEQEYSGTLSGEVDGTPYAGDFKEEAHDHDHDKKK